MRVSWVYNKIKKHDEGTCNQYIKPQIKIVLQFSVFIRGLQTIILYLWECSAATFFVHLSAQYEPKPL